MLVPMPNNDEQPPTAWMDPAEAAALLEVHVDTIRRWADSGLLKARRTLSGHRKILRADVERAVEEMREG